MVYSLGFMVYSLGAYGLGFKDHHWKFVLFVLFSEKGGSCSTIVT